VDIVGCYGANLRKLICPVGLPSVWSYEANEARPTLGKWLARHEEQLPDGLWTATVSGKLPFEQDLLISKLLKGNGRRWADPNGRNLPTYFALLRREVRHAILTSDLLAALRAVATSKEWAALMRLKVVTACAYLKKDQRADTAEWCKTILAAPTDPDRPRTSPGMAQDHRPRDWFAVPLEDFVGRLADERRRLKDRQKATADADEKRRLDGLATVLKLMVNTLYGDLASRHFAIGNTVMFALLDAILAGKDDFPADLTYTRGGILKVATYLLAQASASGFARLKNLRPGDSIPEAEYLARFNNLHMPLTDRADFQSRLRKREHRGHPIQWFERYAPLGIAAVHAHMLANQLREAYTNGRA
jgi:hypothetical protein